MLIGNDGGVWYEQRPRRPADRADPLSAADWADLNGTVDPATAGGDRPIEPGDHAVHLHRDRAADPGPRFWGGTQDNGTLRKSGGSQHVVRRRSGDGGQVLVDPTPDVRAPVRARVLRLRHVLRHLAVPDTAAAQSSSPTSTSATGINLNDRSDFYIPLVLNQDNPNQLFLGTYRLYRTDNAKAASAGDVRWKPISGDLTSGCTGAAPNGARNCTISAIGVGGGQAVYTGSLDGLVYVSPDAQVNDNPTWTASTRTTTCRSGRSRASRSTGATTGSPTPRSTASTARRRASRATSSARTTAASKWTDVSGNLPDTPVNSIVLDPSYPNTLYAGTDVGRVRHATTAARTGGRSARASRSSPSGSSTSTRRTGCSPPAPTAAARSDCRHDRRSGARRCRRSTPASRSGRRATSTYTLTLKNIGNAAATGVTITDPVPDNTSFVSADSGGTNVGGRRSRGAGLTVAPGAASTVHFTVSIATALKKKVTSIVNDGVDGHDRPTASPRPARRSSRRSPRRTP